MILSMPRQKRDAPSGNFTERDAIAGRAVWRLDPSFTRPFDERVKTRPSKHPNFCLQLVTHRHKPVA